MLDGAVMTRALNRDFTVDGLAKSERTGIPDVPDVFDYMARVRQATLVRLADPAAAIDARLWPFVLQHEAQHADTASFLHALALRDEAPGAIAPDTRPLDYATVP